MHLPIRLIDHPRQRRPEETLVITHNGPAHADDCAAAALLSLYHQHIAVIRTREDDFLQTARNQPDWYLIDVGGVFQPDLRNFDHHFTPVPQRSDGLPYSSLGLVAKYLQHNDHDDLIRHIDAADNGVPGVPAPEWWMGTNQRVAPCSIASLVHHAGPLDTAGKQPSAQVFDQFFATTAECMRDLFAPVPAPNHLRLLQHLDQGIKVRQSHEAESRRRMATHIARAQAAGDRIMVLDRFEVAALDCLATLPTEASLRLLVFPGPELWMVQQIPVQPGSHNGRQSLPKAWAGLRDQHLAQASGVNDASFCHHGCFIAGASSREGAIALAQAVLKEPRGDRL